jgi:hypothetical protein
MSYFFRYNNGMAKTPEKRRPGRPPKNSGDLKIEYLDVRLDAGEKEAFWDAANLAGVPLSVWVRERLRTAARRELIEGGRKIAFLSLPKEK